MPRRLLMMGASRYSYEIHYYRTAIGKSLARRDAPRPGLYQLSTRRQMTSMAPSARQRTARPLAISRSKSYSYVVVSDVSATRPPRLRISSTASHRNIDASPQCLRPILMTTRHADTSYPHARDARRRSRIIGEVVTSCATPSRHERAASQHAEMSRHVALPYAPAK